MKKLTLIVMALVLSVAVFHSCNEPLTEDPTSDELSLKSASVAKSYIVVLNDAELNAELSNLKGYEMRQQAAKKAAEKIMNRAGITDGELGLVYGTAIKGFSVKIPQGQLKKLEIDPAVISVTEDKLITLIKPGTEEVSITSTQVIPWGIKRVKGGVTYKGTNVAWIIDTGIDLDHPDLIVAASKGKTFVTRTSTPNDDNGHGTHVAGTVAAIDNELGVVGVAAGATVIPVKVLDRRGSGYMSWIIGGVDFVAANGKSGDVANMSLGGSYYKDLNTAVENAAATKGIKFSLAAGNESTDANTKSPASANGPNIYTVSAMNGSDYWASWSNWGTPIDYCAPGVSIYSTYKDGSYQTLSGTSMAAPHVAGILLLGSIKTDGFVSGDPDGNPDPIGIVGGIQTTTGSITGKVTDGTNSIAGASIVVDNTNFSAISDNLGDYTISNIPTGNYSVTATASGFSSSTVTNVSVLENTTTIVNFSLTSVQTYTVSGTVTDGTTALEGALVEIEGTNLSTITSPEGTYSIPGLESGDYTITVSLIGYESSSQPISVAGDMTVNFSLTKFTSSGITLTATGYKIRGRQTVDLLWSGASAVEIYRNDSYIATVTGTTYTDNIGTLGGGTYTYEVCATVESACSNEANVVF